jgi:hypothetical protein
MFTICNTIQIFVFSALYIDFSPKDGQEWPKYLGTNLVLFY